MNTLYAHAGTSEAQTAAPAACSKRRFVFATALAAVALLMLCAIARPDLEPVSLQFAVGVSPGYCVALILAALCGVPALVALCAVLACCVDRLLRRG